MAKTKIDWCDEVWNPIVGCSRVSAGCDNCYAARMAHRLTGNVKVIDKYMAVEAWDGHVQFDEKSLGQPLLWHKPKRIFVNSMGDIFHKNVPTKWIDDVLEIISACPQHTFMILTKRPELIEEKLYGVTIDNPCRELGGGDYLPNLWLGVSVEDQKTADERIPLLLQTTAAHRFISVEPMLGEVDIMHTVWNHTPESAITPHMKIYDKTTMQAPLLPGINWVICGGENGPGARPIHPDWVNNLYDQCSCASVPFFFKGWGEHLPLYYASSEQILKHKDVGVFADMPTYRVGKAVSGHLLNNREIREIPAA